MSVRKGQRGRYRKEGNLRGMYENWVDERILADKIFHKRLFMSFKQYGYKG